MLPQTQPHLTTPLLLLLFLAAIPFAAAAQDDTPSVSIYDASKQYSYHGCYNETTGLPGVTPTRALADGIHQTKGNNMTVPECLRFCADSSDTKYQFAGVEWSRECWCAQQLSTLTTKLDDAECNFPCSGNDTMACGGALKLSVYELSAASRVRSSSLLAVVGIMWMLALS